MSSNKIAIYFKKSILAQAIRHGLTLAIPFLILGSFALLLRNFPIEGYQNFIISAFGGALSTLLETIYNISLGSLAFVLIITISLSYGRLAEPDSSILYPITSACTYLAFCGGIQGQDDYIFNAEWVFTAMCITLLSSVMLRYITKKVKQFRKLHTTGAEYLFNLSMQNLFPIIVIVILFAVVGYLLRFIWGSTNITNFGSFLFLRIFNGLSGNIFGILLYVLVAHVLWFFGIHGTNTLEAVAQQLFEQNIDINQALLAAGKPPVEIFSKTFLDTFVFLGGCGCALSFVFALCYVSRKKHNRKLAFVALPSALFNISEIAVFGFPIIFNPTMAIPFILTPVILTITSTVATLSGLVPIVSQSVGWTVPIIFSGYRATGSFAGCILQIINIVLGTIIYIPFIKRSEKNQTEEFVSAVRSMEQDMNDGEKNGAIPLYLHHDYPYNYYAKTLAMDLHNAIMRNSIQMHYQPQISAQGRLHGMEALLRWEHPVGGFIAPPVVIALAHEGGFLNELSTYLLNRVRRDAHFIAKEITQEVYLSFNVSPNQMQCDDFFQNVCSIFGQSHEENIRPVLEITERAAMEISDRIKKEIQTLKNQNIQFSLDDFGMGHNSIVYLQEGLFDEVKLDGKLVNNILNNDRSRSIALGIIQMSQKLQCRTIAEFVETAEQRDTLLDIGCTTYQGYYYSRPLALNDFLVYIHTL